MLFFLRNTKADSSANTPNPAVAVAFSPVLANCLSPLVTGWEVFWETVFSTSPKIFCGVASASSFTFCSLVSDFVSLFVTLLSGVSGFTGTEVSWLDATVFTIAYNLKGRVKIVSFAS